MYVITPVLGQHTVLYSVPSGSGLRIIYDMFGNLPNLVWRGRQAHIVSSKILRYELATLSYKTIEDNKLEPKGNKWTNKSNLLTFRIALTLGYNDFSDFRVGVFWGAITIV